MEEYRRLLPTNYLRYRLEPITQKPILQQLWANPCTGNEPSTGNKEADESWRPEGEWRDVGAY
jgi:hypothetical protein